MEKGFTKLVPSVPVVFFCGLSIVFLTLPLKTMNVSVANALWSGMRVALIVTIDVL
ncbi:MAG: SMR family transporter [Rubrobacter sp.]